MSAPLRTYAGILERRPRYVDLIIRDTPDVVAYRFFGNRALNGVFTDPELMFEVTRGSTFRSNGIRQRGQGVFGESTRGSTRAIFDPLDFVAPGKPFDLEDDWLFIRVQLNLRSRGGFLEVGGDPVLGPALCVPPALFYGTSLPSFTLQLSAPNGTACTAGEPVVWDENGTNPRSIVLPRPASETLVVPAEAVDVLVAFGDGQIMMKLEGDKSMQMYHGAAKEIVVASTGAATPVTISGVVNLAGL